MALTPFLKWAGGKRWLVNRPDFKFPTFSGKYVEPFLGGGAAFFNLRPQNAILSDLNPRLIEAYKIVRDAPFDLRELLKQFQTCHTKEFYYEIRQKEFGSPVERAAQFLYLNRTCWNGLYRENLSGKFNVPIGTKSLIYSPDEDFGALSDSLKNAEILCSDFEVVMNIAGEGDFLFVDPPYTTAHNFNGFVKYNQNIFSWEDQVRLKDAAVSASNRGVKVIVTNAHHDSILDLYGQDGNITAVDRASVISGKNAGRQSTSELLISFNL